MKKRIIALISVLLVTFSVTALTEAYAGTVMIGAKAWYLEWDSAFDKAFADMLVNYINATEPTQNWTATYKPGRGFLAGPMIGYQTDDRQWAFSGAFMFINSFKTNTVWNESNVYGGDVKTKTEMDRKDVDLSVSYMLTDFMKVFVGYKYIKATYTSKFDDGSEFYKIEMTSSMPTAGVSFATSLTESLVAGVQFGAMYVKPEYKWDGETIKADNSYGVTVEPNLTYVLSENFMLQMGVRYQIYSVKFTDWNLTKNDQMLGVTASVVFLW